MHTLRNQLHGSFRRPRGYLKLFLLAFLIVSLSAQSLRLHHQHEHETGVKATAYFSASKNTANNTSDTDTLTGQTEESGNHAHDLCHTSLVMLVYTSASLELHTFSAPPAGRPAEFMLSRQQYPLYRPPIA